MLLLDQFPRQICRDSAMAFRGDGQALALSQKTLAGGWVAAVTQPARCQFWLMALIHAEDLAIQEAVIPLFLQSQTNEPPGSPAATAMGSPALVASPIATGCWDVRPAARNGPSCGPQGSGF